MEVHINLVSLLSPVEDPAVFVAGVGEDTGEGDIISTLTCRLSRFGIWLKGHLRP